MAKITAKVRKKDDIIPNRIDTSDSRRKKDHWWLSEKDNAHESMLALVGTLQDEQSYRQDDALKYMRLYGGKALLGFGPSQFAKVIPLSTDDRVTMNAVQSVVDTATNKMAKNRPAPMFLTEGGNFQTRMRARKLNKYVAGVFHQNKVYEQGPMAFKCAAVLGSGFFKVFRKGDSVKIEWVFSHEIKVDDNEALYGKPNNLYQVKFIARDVLMADYPDNRGAILTAQGESEKPGSAVALDHLEVIEAWHLPSSKGAEDGRHVIAIDGISLVDDEWKKDYFPFPKFDWASPLLGFWGRGLPEEVMGLQIEINRLLIKIQKSHHLLAVPWIFRRHGSKVSTSHLRNEIGTIIDYQGEKPEVKTHQTVHPEIYQHLERLYARVFEIAGISQLSAQAKKPAGLDSGVALREFNDIETERFVLVGQAYENFFMETARQVIDVSRDIHAGSGKPRVKTPGKRFIETIDWKDVDLEDAQFEMKVFPISSLPSTPAGKFQAVVERIQAGMLTKEQGMRLLDFPDLSAEDNVDLAALENIDWTINEILEKGEEGFHPPEPFQNLQLGINRMKAAYLLARMDEAPEDILDLLQRWMLEAVAMLNSTQVPAPEQMTQPGSPPELPESELLPAGEPGIPEEPVQAQVEPPPITN